MSKVRARAKFLNDMKMVEKDEEMKSVRTRIQMQVRTFLCW